jgi:hypothetical protein
MDLPRLVKKASENNVPQRGREKNTHFLDMWTCANGKE